MMRFRECSHVALRFAAAVLGAAAVGSVNAQDTRNVIEPVIPPPCVVLKAELSSVKGVFSDQDETRLDTNRLQAALDHCGKGKAVELATDGLNQAFLSGPLELHADVTLLVNKGVTLYASRSPQDYEVGPGTCGVVNEEKQGCKPFINIAHAPNVSVMGDGSIDGRGWAKMLGSSKPWWDLELEVKATGKGRQQVPRLIDTDHTDNLTFYRITLKNSAMTHLATHYCNGITLWGVKIDSPADAKNTDGFDPGGSTNITVINSFIRDGDDNIAIKGSVGPVTHMSVIHNHFYSGHGMSIGSDTLAGVSTLLVRDLTMDGTMWGIRLKSNATRGGLVDGAMYDDVCIRNSKVPISVTTDYFLVGKKTESLPVFRNIVLHNVRISGGTRIELNGFDEKHRLGIQFDGVLITDGVSRYKADVSHADITLGPGPVNLPPLSGKDSTVRGKAGSGSVQSCADRFVPFPETM